MRRFNYQSLVGAILLSFTSGCFDVDEAVSVRVPYKLGAGMSCEEAQVSKVRASLGKDRSQRFEAPCDDSGEIVLNNVQEGKWALVVEGLDAKGAVSLSSEAADPDLVFDFTQGERVTPTVTLTSVPAKVQLRWDLGFGDCDSHDLKGFLVQAWDESEARLLLSGMMDCDAPVNEEHYRTLEDPDGRIIASQLRALTIQPISRAGENSGSPMRIDLEQAPARGAVLRASIACDTDSGGCTLDASSVSVEQVEAMEAEADSAHEIRL